MNDYELLENKVSPIVMQAAGELLDREGFDLLSLEAQLGFIQGVKCGASVWLNTLSDASSKNSQVAANVFAAIIAVAGNRLKTQPR